MRRDLFLGTIVMTAFGVILSFSCSTPEESGPECDSICGCYGVWNEVSLFCECNTGYAGDFCDQCAPGYTGYPDCVPENGATEIDTPLPETEKESIPTEDDTPILEDDTPEPDDAPVVPDEDSCDLEKCNGHGKCQQDGTCKCYQGYAGATCDECAPGYIGYPDCYFKMCEPNMRSCKDDQTVLQCDSEGKEWTEVETCPEGKTCYEGSCLSECEKAEASESYVGCEYWGAFLQNGGGYESNGSYAIVVANPNDTEVTVTVYGPTDQQLTQFTVPPGQINSSQFDLTQFITETGISTKAFKFVASRPVTMTQMNPFGNVLIYSNDASLLLPKGALGLKYFAMSWPTWYYYDEGGGCDGSTSHTYPGYISIIAVEPGTTTVQVTYRGASRAGTGVNAQNPGDTATYSLSQYQVLTINSADASCGGTCYGPDLTGSYIVADKKIAVFGGHQCTFVPADQWACDRLEHQLFPLRSWGKEFVAVRTKPRNAEADYFRILASQDGTTVNWTGGVSGSVTLNTGQFHEFSTTADFVVTASAPILISQVLASQDAGAGTGDPAMMLITPNEQFRKDYIVLVAPNYDYDRITIVAPADTEITFDGNAMNSNSFTPIPGTSWYRNYLDTDDGAHTIVANKPIGLYVYGFSQYVSYAYTGGLDLLTINDVE